MQSRTLMVGHAIDLDLGAFALPVDFHPSSIERAPLKVSRDTAITHQTSTISEFGWTFSSPSDFLEGPNL